MFVLPLPFVNVINKAPLGDVFIIFLLYGHEPTILGTLITCVGFPSFPVDTVAQV